MNRLIRLISPIVLLCLLSFAPTDVVLQDIYYRETGQGLVFANERMSLTVNPATGEWQSWTTAGLTKNLLTTGAGQSGIPNPALDFSINGEYVIAKHGATLLRKQHTVDKDHRSASLAITVGVLPNPNGQYRYELTSSYKLFPREGRVERSARLVRNDATAGGQRAREHVDGFRFQVPGVVISNPNECNLTVPGPFWGHTLVRAGTPYDSLKAKTIRFHSAPDAGFGLFVLSNPTRKLSMASFMSTGGEVAYHSALHGNGQTLTLRHDDRRAYYLAPSQAVESDVHHLDLSSSPAQALETYRRMVTTTMPLDDATPAWVNDQIILEIFPEYFKGGLNEITAKLPFYKGVGFTMIYLMPHWTGGYSPIDPFALEPKIGTKADLRNLVKTAHGLGLKVIFDMVIHGFNKKSPLPKQRPDLFVRTEADTLALHPTWKSVTTDWASPAYQQYMVDLVLHDQREYGIDGYRVDAATYKGAGWNPHVPYPAYRDGSAAPELMRLMLTALRKKNPDAVLLSEVFGPVFYTICNFVHDNQTEAVPQLQEFMAQGRYSAADYKAHLATVFGALPKGANRVFYARNHDTSWFYHFDGYTTQFMAFEAVHALFGIPEAFAGDPDHKFNPDDDPQTFAQYKRLFNVRKQFAEFSRGAVLLDQITSNNRHVFSGLRQRGSQTSAVLVSFSGKPETATITLDGLTTKAGSLTDVYTGQPIKLTPVGAGAFSLTLKPFQAVAGRL